MYAKIKKAFRGEGEFASFYFVFRPGRKIQAAYV